ncbi:MAG TPA: hypothetical protein VJP78_03545, partial [Thermoleophilia bacterium]|nr:hypothetical protein [Thermoleophilia bacterium]
MSSETPRPHQQFEVPEGIHFPIPFGMDRHLAVHLARTVDVVLEYMADDDQTKEEVNGLFMTPPGPGKDPQLSPEDVAKLMLAMAHVHAEDAEAEDARVYRIRQHWKDDQGKVRRKFWRFEWRPSGYDAQRARPGRVGAGSDQDSWGDHVMDEGAARFEYQQRSWALQQRQQSEASSMAMKQIESTLNTILSANTSVLSEQRLMNEENRIALRESRAQTAAAQDRLFKMAIALTANNEHQEQLQQKSMEMFTMGWSWYMTSMNQQSVLQERRHRDEIARLNQAKAEDGKWNWVGQFAPAFLAAGAALLSKMGMPGGDLLEDAAAEAAKAEAAKAAGAGGAPAGFESVPQDPPVEDEPQTPPSAHAPPP